MLAVLDHPDLERQYCYFQPSAFLFSLVTAGDGTLQLD